MRGFLITANFHRVNFDSAFPAGEKELADNADALDLLEQVKQNKYRSQKTGVEYCGLEHNIFTEVVCKIRSSRRMGLEYQ